MMDKSPQCYILSFVEIGPLVPEKKIFEGFHHIWTWRPSWSCDPDAANKFSFPLLKFGYDWPSSFREEDVCIVDDGRTDNDKDRRRIMAISTISSPCEIKTK